MQALVYEFTQLMRRNPDGSYSTQAGRKAILLQAAAHLRAVRALDRPGGATRAIGRPAADLPPGCALRFGAHEQDQWRRLGPAGFGSRIPNLDS